MHAILTTGALIFQVLFALFVFIFILTIAYSLLKDDLEEMGKSFLSVIKPWIMLRSEYEKERHVLSQQRIKQLEKELGFNEDTQSFGDPTVDEIILLERMNQRKNRLIGTTKK